jgi:hypothetical protein
VVKILAEAICWQSIWELVEEKRHFTVLFVAIIFFVAAYLPIIWELTLGRNPIGVQNVGKDIGKAMISRNPSRHTLWEALLLYNV